MNKITKIALISLIIFLAGASTSLAARQYLINKITAVNSVPVPYSQSMSLAKGAATSVNVEGYAVDWFGNQYQRKITLSDNGVVFYGPKNMNGDSFSIPWTLTPGSHTITVVTTHGKNSSQADSVTINVIP